VRLPTRRSRSIGTSRWIGACLLLSPHTHISGKTSSFLPMYVHLCEWVCLTVSFVLIKLCELRHLSVRPPSRPDGSVFASLESALANTSSLKPHSYRVVLLLCHCQQLGVSCGLDTQHQYCLVWRVVLRRRGCHTHHCRGLSVCMLEQWWHCCWQCAGFRLLSMLCFLGFPFRMNSLCLIVWTCDHIFG
jgi:hypothetical protein